MNGDVCACGCIDAQTVALKEKMLLSTVALVLDPAPMSSALVVYDTRVCSRSIDDG